MTSLFNIKIRILKMVKGNPLFYLSFSLIFALGIFLRTYKWLERIYVHSDNSLYAQIAKYANDTLSIPQIGVFPQAPFFTGPQWLWVLQIFYILPFGVLSPWYAMTFFSIVFILLIFVAAFWVGGKKLGLLAAFFAAISPAQIDNSFSVWNTSADPLLHLLAIIFLIRFYKYKKLIDIFLVAFTVSFAITVRFQNMITVPIIAVALFSARPKFKYLLSSFLGFAIPLLPFLYFDLRFNWFELGRIWDYATIGQYRIYVPNRWLTYAGVWWPGAWGSVIGGVNFVGGAFIFLVSAMTLVALKNFKKNVIILLIAISFALEVIIFRYYRGERFVYYSLFAHAPILILSSWALWKIFKFQKFIGLILIFCVAVLIVNLSYKNLETREVSLEKIDNLRREIYNGIPSQDLDIYGCTSNGSRIARPLALLIYADARNDASGIKVGVCENEDKYDWRILTEKDAGGDSSWFAATTSTTHNSAIEWWKQNPPR